VAFALVITSGSGRGRRFRFDAQAVDIGRAPDNDVVLNHAGVSRTHARIELKPSGWMLSDRASANGVELNGAAVVGPAQLRQGDRIGVGPVTFEFRLQGERIASHRPRWTSPAARASLAGCTVLLIGVGSLYAIRIEPREGFAHAPAAVESRARPPDPIAARASYERGRRKLAERRVAPRNLYDAWMAFRAARDQLDGDAALAGEVARLAADCERDLRRECDRLLFAAGRFERHGQEDKARQTWREILLHYPGDDPGGCRRRAEETLLSPQADERIE
jgi:predicted component of type VI protein secretion system